MMKYQNTCNNAPFGSFPKRISLKAISVFRTVWAVLHIEPGPSFRYEELQIIFANIRV